MTDDPDGPPFDNGADLPDAYDGLIWDAVPVDRDAPAPPPIEAVAAPSRPPVHTAPETPADEDRRPVTLHVEQSDVG